MSDGGIRRVWKLKKRFDEARKKLARRLPLLSVDELRRVLSSNTIEAILEGRLRIPESTLAKSIEVALDGRVRDVEVVLDEGSLSVSGRYVRLRVEIDFHIRATDLTFVPLPQPGVLSMELGEVEVGGGDIPLRRLLSMIVLAILRFIYGDRLVRDQLEEVRGVTLEDRLFTCRLAELPQVSEVVERRLLGVRLGDLMQVTDILFVPGSVEVGLSVAEALEKAARMVDPMKRPGR